MFLNVLSRSFSHNLPRAGKLSQELYLSPNCTLTKRDCVYTHGGGQPVPPTLNFSDGSSHGRS